MSCSNAIANAADKSPPDASLLEFLGESVQVGKDRVDPLSLQSQSVQDKAAKHDTKGTASRPGKTNATNEADSKYRQPAHE